MLKQSGKQRSSTAVGLAAKFQAELEQSIIEIESFGPDGIGIDDEDDFRHQFEALCDDQPLPELEETRRVLLRSSRGLLNLQDDISKAAQEDTDKPSLGEDWQSDHDAVTCMLEKAWDASVEQIDRIKGAEDIIQESEKNGIVSLNGEERDMLQKLGLILGDSDKDDASVLALLKDAERSVKRMTKHLPDDDVSENEDGDITLVPEDVMDLDELVDGEEEGFEAAE